MRIEDLDLRQAVLHNLRGATSEELREMITDAIATREEKALPGLGVLFELLWTHSSPQEQQHMLSTLEAQVNPPNA